MSNPKGSIVRRSFSKFDTKIEIRNLLEIQKQSYLWFLQRGIPTAQRKDIGLQAAFTSVFPISDYNQSVLVEFIEYSIGDPKYDLSECLERGMTYAASLKIRVRLVVWDKEPGGGKTVKDIREQEIYMGELPLMTENGTFLVNGIERVVVSQLQRSSGAFFTHDKGKVHPSGKVLYSARIIPYRGSWLDFEFDAKDILYVRIDRRRKFPVTAFLKAFIKEEGKKDDKRFVVEGREGKIEGKTIEETILKLFYPIEEVSVVEGSVFRRLDPEIHTGIQAPINFLDREKEVLVKKGGGLTKAIIRRMRSEGIKEVLYPREELVGKTTLEDILHPETGDLILEKRKNITDDDVDRIVASGVRAFKLLHIDNINTLPVIRDTMMTEKIVSPDEAKVEIYRRVRPGETPTVDAARLLFENLFFNFKQYDLSSVGRMKLNKKLSLDVPLTTRTMTDLDVIEVVRYLVQLRAGKGEIDDIDHLGNRRVRSVGELLENQFRVGLIRMERTVKERMNTMEMETVLPHDLINAKPVLSAIREFFMSSQLSQFMDQTNPLAEITHKRRMSALGPGGLTRERAGFEVRDVHPSHYGRICPIETPEGPNIGLIMSLATYGRINEFGFIESPHRKVVNGRVSDEVVYLSAIDSDRGFVGQFNTPMDGRGKILAESVSARHMGEFVAVPPEKVDYMDVSPKQIVSVVTALIPFLEHDDANRALMGSNMQRQAVPLIRAEAPLVGTGMEQVIARDSGHVIFAKRGGVVESVDATRISIKVAEGRKRKSEEDAITGFDIYRMAKFQRSNQSTCIHQKPLVDVGDIVEAGDLLADGPSISRGNLALGQNILVAFMPWGGYNFEDAILISERLVKEDRFSSIHIEVFDLEARETKLGKEEITQDIPNISEDAIKDLDESGIVRIGAEIKQGDILIGKVTPKGETPVTPEEKLLRAIFGEKAGDVKDASLYVPPGVEGVVVDVKISSRRNVEREDHAQVIGHENLIQLQRDHHDELRIIAEEKNKKIREFLLDRAVGVDVLNSETGGILLKKKSKITETVLKTIPDADLRDLFLLESDEQERVDRLEAFAKETVEEIQAVYDERAGRLKRGDELPPGVLKLVKVYVAVKRKIQVGDKMAGRHGNKGVVSRVLPEEEMPYMPDGTPVDMVLNPLGVPSRMNVGQILEAHLGWAAHTLGIMVETPVFDGATEKEIKAMLVEAGLPESGQIILRDGRTGEPFKRPVTVGSMYMMKLHHMVDDKLHARSIGPYSLVTQQPLGGKAQFGGQRLGEMEVWALQAYGAAYTLQEFLTVKSDDVPGRSLIYEAIVKGEPFLEPGLPESFNVLVKELQSLGLDVELSRKETLLGKSVNS